MKVITDERLVIKNLKNIRFAFVFQTLALVGILLYDGITKGFNNITNNPIWLVLILTSVILGYLNLSISVDSYENEKRIRKVPYYLLVLCCLAAGVIFGLLTKLTSNSSLADSIIIGSVIFLCFLGTFSFGYFLIKKRSKDDEE
ncbi:branched-chain amino acid ABC transporter substrate-binding protein [Priestia megaterium]|uniref:branched-chain amino acid ABC transporter substrate-binding protein n=1 Tax=Priestia megaterium TaxID=1404 RepID=UPI000BF4070D|nr:branched-chain amino acid ABC transporter substrate-binding protein [Priestia megaterium]PER67563.1 branched-chain amino acid ABC transporter substrate-binding protein [Priestia megaterium]PGN53175.1 branched-chain amino acid ABC transporter substrate-binding protein [Priestia megaterium]PGQ87622.1 branched-chain amino acid ABC transporter substrate-binding protein [Priestia megaterium]